MFISGLSPHGTAGTIGSGADWAELLLLNELEHASVVIVVVPDGVGVS
jgi:hypothetical protein